jgi:hypothetical protein
MRRDNGKFLWWDTKDGRPDVMDVQLTEMYHSLKGRQGDYVVIGQREYIHIQRGVPPQPCGPTRATCPVCMANHRASQQFKTILFAWEIPGVSKAIYGGQEFVSTLGTTLASKLAEAQKMLKGMGFTDEEILAVRFRVAKVPGAPGQNASWDVNPVAPPVRGAKPLIPSMTVNPPAAQQQAPVQAPAYGQAPAQAYPGSPVYGQQPAYQAPPQYPQGYPQAPAPTPYVPPAPAPVAQFQAPPQYAPVAPVPPQMQVPAQYPGADLFAQAPVAAPAPQVPNDQGVAVAPEAPQVTFSQKEVDIVKALNDNIQARFDPKSTAYDPTFGPRVKPSIEATLKAKKFAKGKIEFVKSLVDEQTNAIQCEKLAVSQEGA